MAVIGKIREKSTLLLIVVGGALMAFILTDLFSSRSSVFDDDLQNIGKINGKDIRGIEFNERYEVILDRYKQESKGEDIPEFIHGQIRDEVWKQYLQELILEAEMDELGIVISTEELADLTYGDNPHQFVRSAFTNNQTGIFNKNDVINFLKNMERDETGDAKRQWLSLEAEMKRLSRHEKYYNLIKKGLYATTFESQLAFQNQNKSVAISYIVKRYADVADSTVSVSQSDIQKYYDDNKSKFVEKKSRKIEYSIFRVLPSSEDSAAAEKWVNSTYEQFKLTNDDSTFVNANSDKEFDFRYYSKSDNEIVDTNLFEVDSAGYTLPPYIEGESWRMVKISKIKFAPDSVEARHILLSADKTNMETVRERMDSIKNVIESQPAESVSNGFAEMAQKFSVDPGSTDNGDGGNLGWFKEGFMIPVINDSCFNGELNKLMIIESAFGLHLLEVTAKSPVVKKLQIATIYRSIDASRETMDDQFSASNDLSVGLKEGDDMADKTMSYNAEYNSIDIKENDFMVPEIESSRGLIRWAYNAELGDVSEALQYGSAFVVARLLEIHDDGVAPLERVIGEAEIGAIKAKKAENFKAEMQGVTDIDLASENLNLTLETASSIVFDSYSIPGLGREPEVLGKIFTMGKGDLSVPIKGEGGVYIIRIDNVQEIEQDDASVRLAGDQLTASRSSRVDFEVFEALKENGEVEDRRYKFY